MQMRRQAQSLRIGMPTVQSVLANRVEFEVNEGVSEDEEAIEERQRGDSGSAKSSIDDPKDTQQVPPIFESTV